MALPHQDSNQNAASVTDLPRGVGAWCDQEYKLHDGDKRRSLIDDYPSVPSGTRQQFLDGIDQHNLDHVEEHDLDHMEEHEIVSHSESPGLFSHIDLNRDQSDHFAPTRCPQDTQIMAGGQHNDCESGKIALSRKERFITSAAAAPVHQWQCRCHNDDPWLHLQDTAGTLNMNIETCRHQSLPTPTSLQLTSDGTGRCRSHSA